MNESQFTQSINKQIKNEVYVWKINCNFAKGVPDAYYSGDKADLWVEYKYLQSTPKRSKIIPNLSRLQQKWLTRAKKQGRNVAVVVGTPDGCYVLKEENEWHNGVIPNSDNVLHKKEVARWIESITCRGEDNHVKRKPKKSTCQTIDSS